MQNFRLMYSNKEKSNPNIIKAKRYLNETEKIIFLGFGYDEYNMEQLGLKKYAGRKELIGGFFSENKDKEKDVKLYFNNKIVLYKGTCIETLKQYA